MWENRNLVPKKVKIGGKSGKNFGKIKVKIIFAFENTFLASFSNMTFCTLAGLAVAASANREKEEPAARLPAGNLLLI